MKTIPLAEYPHPVSRNNSDSEDSISVGTSSIQEPLINPSPDRSQEEPSDDSSDEEGTDEEPEMELETDDVEEIDVVGISEESVDPIEEEPEVGPTLPHFEPTLFPSIPVVDLFVYL